MDDVAKDLLESAEKGPAMLPDGQIVKASEVPEAAELLKQKPIDPEQP